jgi:hypothetical protein
MPLQEEPAAVGVLLLDHSHQDEPARLNVGPHPLVPDRHVPTTARSPGRELDQEHLPAPKRVERKRLPVGKTRQNDRGEALPCLTPDGGCVGAGREREQSQ